VLIGAETLALVREAVTVEAVEPLTLKGKTKPVPAFRLVSAPGELRRRLATPMVGRESDLRRLRDAFAQEALDRYERKRNLAMARQVRERLAEVQPA
jgi:hypothetical protein